MYKCSYKHCIHLDELIPKNEAVMRGNRRYHWDCIAQLESIKRCAMLFIGCSDKTKDNDFPKVMNILNTIVIKNKVPVDFIEKHLESHYHYYKDKEPVILFGLRKIFWQNEMSSKE